MTASPVSPDASYDIDTHPARKKKRRVIQHTIIREYFDIFGTYHFIIINTFSKIDDREVSRIQGNIHRIGYRSPIMPRAYFPNMHMIGTKRRQIKMARICFLWNWDS